VLVEGGEVASANAPLPELLAWSREGRDERCSGEDGEACSRCSSRNTHQALSAAAVTCASVYLYTTCFCELRNRRHVVCLLVGTVIAEGEEGPAGHQQQARQINMPSTVRHCCSMN
jgi:hypothetical protein